MLDIDRARSIYEGLSGVEVYQLAMNCAADDVLHDRQAAREELANLYEEYVSGGAPKRLLTKIRRQIEALR